MIKIEQLFKKLATIASAECKINENYEPSSGDYANSLRKRVLIKKGGIIRLERKKLTPLDQLHKDICEECCGIIAEIQEMDMDDKYC